jgi:RNA polymerase sigma-70 factor (ECF subfamily)
MALSGAVPGPAALSSGRFATTHWSLVVAARDQDTPQAREALGALCQAYWYPLYAFIRRQGHAVEEAQDLTQEFFARLLEKGFLRSVNPEKGKFRSFLLSCCKHFLANERDRARAQKRGGKHVLISLDFQTAESRYAVDAGMSLAADKLFDRRWAIQLLEQVLNRLREEFVAAGKVALFERLEGQLQETRSTAKYEQLAVELGTTVGAVKVAVHRMRKRYRELLREEIARTLQDPSEVDAEIRDLFTIVGS